MLATNKLKPVPHELPRLPYALDALQPFMSRETLEFHYGRHHRGYVDKLNSAVQDTDLEHAPLETLIRTSTGALYNNAAQVWNHNFLWRCLAPGSSRTPSRDFAKVIAGAFGSANTFRQLFTTKALEKFGSGWTWLVKTHDERLVLVNTDDAENPLKFGTRALLTCDVWEHAYYIDYRNDRAKYLDAWWNLVNWDFVEANYAK